MGSSYTLDDLTNANGDDEVTTADGGVEPVTGSSG